MVRKRVLMKVQTLNGSTKYVALHCIAVIYVF